MTSISSPDSLPIVTTPIYDYVHQERGTAASLIGTIHYAQPAYFETVQSAIADRELQGAAVHYEGILNSTTDELASASWLEKAKIRWLEGMLTIPRGFIEIDGIVSQWDGMQFADHWQNNDVHELEIVQRMSAPSLLVQILGVKALGFIAGRMNADAKHSLALQVLEKQTAENKAQSSWLKRVIARGDQKMQGHRNGVALQGVDKHFARDPEAGLVFVWGAGHLPSLDADLVGRGFVKVAEEHVKAIDLNELATKHERP